MLRLEVFFDYICPFCLRGHEMLAELLKEYPDITVEWRPCEAHPRPEKYGRHSDLCARAMLFAQESGANLEEFHRRMYSAALSGHADIEDADSTAGTMDGLLDRAALREALVSCRYEDALAENNRLVWDEYDCPAVPSYRMNGEMLKSVPGVGVEKQSLAAFLQRHAKTV